MEYLNIKIKLSFVEGLRSVVLDEVQQKLDVEELSEYAIFESEGEPNSIYIQFPEDIENPLKTILDTLTQVKKLKSVARAYIVQQDGVYNPIYISKHKFLVGELIEIILRSNGSGDQKLKEFKTFKISCAGADSKEVRSIAKYVEDTYKLVEQEEADLKIHIIKPADMWEVGIQTTPRPLSMREYKVRHMSGAMDPTVAYAMNYLAVKALVETGGANDSDGTGGASKITTLSKKTSYLNAFSGSATLLIEAALEYPNLEPLIGFDYNKEHLSLAIQNIKKAGLIKRVQLKEANIFDKPIISVTGSTNTSLAGGTDTLGGGGAFDIITADLPFGMSISKGEDLAELYGKFLEYCQGTLSPDGKIAVYTSEIETFEKALRNFGQDSEDATRTDLGGIFKIEQELKIRSMTNTGAYLETKIFVCGR